MLYNQPYGGAADAPYVNGDPSIGLAGSIPPAASIEYPQREIVNLINDVALATPTNSDLHQLAKAIQSQKLISKDDTGTFNAYSVTLVPAPTAYFKYMTVIMQVVNTNTGPSVINVNALGNKSITNRDGSALVGGEMLSTSIICLVYDGTKFQFVWSSRVAGDRIGLTAPKTFFVNGTTGNDTTLDGTQATVSGTKGPFATIQKAVNQMSLYDNNGFAFTISVADFTTGSGYGFVTLPRITGSGVCHVVGNITTPTNVKGVGFGGTGTNGTYWIRGFNLINAAGDGIFGDLSGTIFYLSNLDFGACSGPAQIVMQRGATAIWAGTAQGVSNPTWRVSGASPSAILVSDGGQIAIYPQALTLSGTPNFASAFAWAQRVGVISSPTGTTFLSVTGTATGTRFNVITNSVIDAAGAGATVYPGSISGTTATGGQYV